MIRASAGSGKTWQLANRYLALLALGVKPERIIALTFTRKAAGEFADRILSRLAEGAESEENAAQLGRELKMAILGDDSMPPLVEGAITVPKMGVSFFQDLLETIVAAIDQLALSTLDSFFVKLLRNFAFELGMSGFDLLEGYDLESERLRVFAEIFQRSGQIPAVKKDMDQFVAAFSQTSAGEESIRLTSRLEEFVQKHQYRWLKYPDAESWGSAAFLWPEGFPWPEGGHYKVKAKRVRELLATQTFPHKSYVKSLVSMCDSLIDRDGKEGTPLNAKGRFPVMVENISELANGQFTDVFSRKEMLIEGELAEAIYELVGAVISDEIQAKLSRTKGVYNVIKAYETRYNSSVRGQGKLGFSDATLLLAGHDSTGLFDAVSKELVEFRFDGKYDHWMLDEFQDTSISQWQVVKNLIDEVVLDNENERSLFVVGDTKQGIYGWRGGEPKLFDQLADRYGTQISQWDMDTSYRSSDSVLSLVNSICNPRGNGMRIFPRKAVDRWKFETHTAAIDKPGHSWVCEMEASQNDDLDTDTLKHQWIGALVEKISPLKRELSCAILVRKNERAREIAEYLREHHPEIPVAVEDESLVAEENPVSAAIVDAFRFLCYPADSLAWRHVLMSPFGAIFHDDPSDNELRQSQTWYYWNGQISEHGIDQVLATWIAQLQKTAKISKYSKSKLEELELAAADFSSKGGSLTEWLKLLENWSQREVTRAGVVQIMTVHKAKGLGFDAVILPDLENRAFDDEGRLSILEDEGHVMLPPTKDIRSADPILKAQVEQWAADQCYEQFCVLYVMLTRAVHGTYCLLDATKDKPEKRKKNEADWIRESIANLPEREETLGENVGRVTCEYGNWQWLNIFDKAEVTEKHLSEIPAIKLPKVESRRKSLIASKQKYTNFAKMVMDRSGLDFGNKVHACFESVQWWEGELAWNGDKVVKDIVTDCMNEPSIVPYFTYQDSLKVYREQAIEAIVDGVWSSGIVDRLLISYDVKGEIENIAIIDFKTDRVESKDELRELYRAQVEQYKLMLASVYPINPNFIYGVLISTHLKISCVL